MNLESAEKGDELIFLGFTNKAERLLTVDRTTSTRVIALVNERGEECRFRKKDGLLVGTGYGLALLTKLLSPEMVQDYYAQIQEAMQIEQRRIARKKATSELDRHISKIQTGSYQCLTTEDVMDLNHCFRGIFGYLDT
jgi:hypothetical protein